jgi:hypothetical protein
MAKTTTTTIESLLAQYDALTADALKAWLAACGYTVRELAEALPHSKRSLEGWTSGRYAIPPYFWRALRDLEREKKERKA